MFRDLCIVNGFGFICNDMITTKYRWKDLQDLGTSILSKKCIDFVNNYLFSNFDNHFWLNESHQTNNFDSDIGGLINFRKAYQNNPFIGYIDINSLRGKIVSLREVLSKASTDIWCIDETKLDVSFPDHQFWISGYQFSPIRRDRSSKGRRAGNSFCWRRFCLWNKWKTLRLTMLKLYVSNQLLPKRSGGLFFFTNSQTQIKLCFLMKSILLWIKYLASMTYSPSRRLKY